MQEITAYLSTINPAILSAFVCGVVVSGILFIAIDILTPLYYKIKKWMRILKLKH